MVKKRQIEAKKEEHEREERMETSLQKPDKNRDVLEMNPRYS